MGSGNGQFEGPDHVAVAPNGNVYIADNGNYRIQYFTPIGSFLGSVLGGLLADSVGFNAINWMGAIAAGIASLLIFISLWPAERKKQAEEAAVA